MAQMPGAYGAQPQQYGQYKPQPVPPQLMTTMNGGGGSLVAPGAFPPGYGSSGSGGTPPMLSPYATGTYAPQPGQQQVAQKAPSAPPPMQSYAPPASSGQQPQGGYSGVPVVIGGSPMGGSGVTNDSLNALYQMGTGPVDTSALDATNAALMKQMQLQASQAGAYGASAAFGQGGAGTPIQMISQQNAANAMVPINAQMQQANLGFYNQQSANQLGALQAATQGGLGMQNQALQQQIAMQNALFGANTQNLATQGQAFNQGITSQQQQMNMYNSLFGAGGAGQGANQANLDAMYQMYGTTDPTQILMQMMGQVPMTQQQTTPFNPFNAVMPGVMGYGMAGGFGQQQPGGGGGAGGGFMPVPGIPGVSQMPGGGYVNFP